LLWLRTHIIVAREVFLFCCFKQRYSFACSPISDGGLKKFLIYKFSLIAFGIWEDLVRKLS